MKLSDSTRQAPIRVLIAGDHALLRAGVRIALSQEPEFEIVGEAATGIDAQQLAIALGPDVLLLDLSMPGPSATQIVRVLHEKLPELRVVVLTAFDDDVYVRMLIASGISGYVLIDNTIESIGEAVRVVMSGGTWFNSTTLRALAAGSRVGEGCQLTQRELDVLSLMDKGLSNAAIAGVLGVGRRTAESHARRLFAKLDVHSRTEAIHTARGAGLLPNR